MPPASGPRPPPTAGRGEQARSVAAALNRSMPAGCHPQLSPARGGEGNRAPSEGERGPEVRHPYAEVDQELLSRLYTRSTAPPARNRSRQAATGSCQSPSMAQPRERRAPVPARHTSPGNHTASYRPAAGDLPIVRPADDVGPADGGREHVLALALRGRRHQLHARQPPHSEQALAASVIGSFDRIEARTAGLLSARARPVRRIGGTPQSNDLFSRGSSAAPDGPGCPGSCPPNSVKATRGYGRSTSPATSGRG